MSQLPIRPRRLRRSEALRRLVREHALAPEHILVETSPDEPPAAEAAMARFGGAWLTVSDDAGSLDAVKVARAAVGEGCLAVDLRHASQRVEMARGLLEAGADLFAVEGPDIAALRNTLEADGAVNALIAACASFPLDAAEGTIGVLPDADDWAAAGADLLLIEPALPNLDRIRAASESWPVPIIARVTHAELAMYAASFERGWLDEAKIPAEVMVSLRRAGARVAVVPGSWAAAFVDASP